MEFKSSWDLTPPGQLFLQETFCVSTDVKYFEQRPMRERRECKKQNFISFLVVLIIRLIIRLIIYQKCPFMGQLSLAGYAQIFVPLGVKPFLEINIGKRRIRHTTTLKLNDGVIQIPSRSMSDTPLSDIDFKNKTAWVCTTLKTLTFCNFGFCSKLASMFIGFLGVWIKIVLVIKFYQNPTSSIDLQVNKTWSNV